MQITSLPATSTLSANDVLAVEVNGVTYKITASTLASMLQTISGTLSVANGGTGITSNPSMLINLASATAAGVFQASPRPGVTGLLPLANGGLGKDFSAATNAGFHNSIYRGKNLGTSFTSAQSAAIAAGTFDDLFVGDYWVINGVNWCIADFDTYYQSGDTALATHHIAVVPQSNMYTTAWNESSGVGASGGYVGSAIRTNLKAASGSSAGAEAKYIDAFGDSHVLSYRAYYPTTYDSDGVATAGAWTDARVELLSEMEAFGSPIWSAMGLGYEVGIGKRQLSIFKLNPTIQNTGSSWWLRNLRSSTTACVVSRGLPVGINPTGNGGVRPFGLIS